jgi:hypothetical protein
MRAWFDFLCCVVLCCYSYDKKHTEKIVHANNNSHPSRPPRERERERERREREEK